MDVAAGGKGPVSGAGDDDAADRVVGVELLDRFAHLARQLAVHRIELVGAVEGDDADAVFRIDQDMLVTHRFLQSTKSGPRPCRHAYRLRDRPAPPRSRSAGRNGQRSAAGCRYSAPASDRRQTAWSIPPAEPAWRSRLLTP